MRRFLFALLALHCAPAAAREGGRGTPIAVRAVPVAVDEAQFAGTRLVFLGAVALAGDAGFGALTGLRWNADEKRLFAVGSGGRWFEIATQEEQGRLTGIAAVRGGALLDVRGMPATNDAADAEALDFADGDGWQVLIGRQRRVLAYTHLDGKPVPATLGVGADYLNGAASNAPMMLRPHEKGGALTVQALEPIAANENPSAFARTASSLLCARRTATTSANCIATTRDGTTPMKVAADPLADAVPTDMAGDLALMQSPGANGRAAIVQVALKSRTLATFTPPGGLALEGLAIRGERMHSYLYIVSDSHRGTGPTTVFKFELLAHAPKRSSQK